MKTIIYAAQLKKHYSQTEKQEKKATVDAIN
jgi:hypothetical protein